MNSLDNSRIPVESNKTPTAADGSDVQPNSAKATAHRREQERQELRRWWMKLLIQPALLLACGAILIVALGVAQRLGFISSGGGSGSHGHAASGDSDVPYICPMMCTPPQSEPGRCPVCAMELVPAAAGGGQSGSRWIDVDPVARRVANIRTVTVKAVPMTRTIRAVGELSYDEGALKTISAYVDGRLDRLYADYTGIEVAQGDHLALVYSPRLYSGQVELLLAKRSREEGRSDLLQSVIDSGGDLYENARERLIELGMTSAQIERLEAEGKASSRMHLCAPISGTVIEKLAVEGEYVKEGQAIYKLADLSTVWLMLELFPDDAAAIRYGQRVVAHVQSLPGEPFTGRVAFVDPTVDRKTRTVGVRVVLPNRDGRLRIGDYAKATIEVALANSGNPQREIYDPELADKWISPRHPHVVESSPGRCRVCGIPLVPAEQFGFSARPSTSDEVLVVPRNAVLMAGDNSVVYVETSPGRFEIRQVVLGPSIGEKIVILEGVAAGEYVASSGNFLIDSQMQLAGNPSLIDPAKVDPNTDAIGTESTKLAAALSALSAEDRALVEQQRICPVADCPLCSMGAPVKVTVKGVPVFLCCEGCRESLLEEPDKYLAKLAAGGTSADAEESLPQMDLPPIGVPELVEPQRTVPEKDTGRQDTIHETRTRSRPTTRPVKKVAGRAKEAVR